MKNTTWGLETVKDIEKIEARLLKANFASSKPYIAMPEKFWGWKTRTTVYSLGEETVTIRKFQKTLFGHKVFDYDRGDVVINVNDENYRKLLLGLPT